MWVTAFIRDCKTRWLVTFDDIILSAGISILYSLRIFKRNNRSHTNHTGHFAGLAVVSRNRPEPERGGRHASYRGARFLRWYESEAEPDAWANPIHKVKPPKVTHKPISGVPIEAVKAMCDTCGDNFTGVRDRGLLLCLLDTGAWACEFLALNLDDVDFVSGAVDIHKGKGGKSWTVFVGKKSRKALRVDIRLRTDNDPALWVTHTADAWRSRPCVNCW